MNDKMKVGKIDVSVIVPMYNVENLISETIQSLKNNECNFEVILINDGSTDSTLESVHKAINLDKRFVIINQRNQGVSVARNKGMRRAEGKYIFFVDSDDMVADRALDRLLEAAQLHNADLVYGKIWRFNSQKKWMTQSHVDTQLFVPGSKNIIDNPELFNSIAPWGKLIKRSLLQDCCFPKGLVFSEDQVVTFHILTQAENIYCIDQDIYFYRERDDISGEASATQQRDSKAVLYLNNVLIVIKTNMLAIYKNDYILDDKVRNSIFSNYLRRIVTYELWPLVLRILKYHPQHVEKMFQEIELVLSEMNTTTISDVAALRYFFIRVLSDNIFHIKGYKAFAAYRHFLIFLFNSFDEGVYSYFSKTNSYGKRWDDSLYLARSNVVTSYCYFLYLRPKKKIFSTINKNKVRLIKKYWFPLCKLLPKQNNKVIFASTTSKPMGDNFNHIINQLRKNHQLDSFKLYKFLGSTNSTKKLLFRYFHSATAKTIFLENYYNPYYGLSFSKKTNVVQLWHACGAFKQFAHDALNQRDSNTLEFENNAHSFYTHVTVSSSGIKENYSSAFDLHDSKIKSLGVPRTDLFFDFDKIAKIKSKILKRYPYLSATKNILYSPTFRGGPAERKTFNLSIDWNELKEMPRNYKFIIKLHPVVERIYPEIPDWIKDRVLVLNAKENVNDWMLFCDVLITDYSSLIFEYSLLDKPIVYYPFDLKEYFNERGFYYSYDTYVYGEVAYTSNELVQAILNAEMKYESFYEAKEAFKTKFMGNCDGNSSQRIIHHFLDQQD